MCYFDAHYGWRPVIIYAQGRKVTGQAFIGDAQCTQLANIELLQRGKTGFNCQHTPIIRRWYVMAA